MTFFIGFLIVAGVTYTTAMLPGPDMALVIKNSLLRSKKEGVLTALGISVGTCVYVALALAGLGVVITKSVLLFSVLKYLGAAYIVYLGVKMIRARQNADLLAAHGDVPRSGLIAFREGFLTNLGNPKFLLFLFGIFTQVITPDTPFVEQLVYGLEIPIFAFLSFSTLSFVAGADTVRKALAKNLHYVERGIGALLIGLGVKVALSSNN